MVLDNFDIIRDAPGKFTPKVITTNTYVTDGTITIDFTAVTSDPSLNGIEVIYTTGSGGAPSAPTVPIPVPTPAQLLVPVPAPIPAAPITLTNAPIVSPVSVTGNLLYRINSGSSSQVIVPPNNLVWDPDQFVLTGLPFNDCSNMTGSIYCSGRSFQPAYGTPFRYDIPIPASNRTYQVKLHFAESVRVF